jgi:hypothetical protein
MMGGASGIGSSWFPFVGFLRYSLVLLLIYYYLAHILKKRLDAAIEELNLQREAFDVFTSQQAEYVQQWREMVVKWEAQREGKNPYELPLDGMLLFSKSIYLSNPYLYS